MKILHTSDWHLGRSIYGTKRYEEFEKFLAWLAQTIETEKVDALLVAGDVFDSSTPSNRAQELYYRFLCRVAASCCRHVVVIAGNHDSPSFLNAPKELLRVLNVYVVGSVSKSLDGEVIVLEDKNQTEMIVCAVPYLRDRDIRTVEPGETIDDKNAKLIEGIKKHYAEVLDIADQKRHAIIKRSESKNPQPSIPVVAMGHLFTDGGRTVDGDGVRELYVGSLAHVDKEAFPASIDYLALGHLHVPQFVGNADHIRYSGSPMPIGFGEANQEKKIILVDFNSRRPEIEEINVPRFQQLARIVGSLDEIYTKLENLKKERSSAWLEIEYTGEDIIGNLREILDENIAGSALEILRIKNRRVMDRVMNAASKDETLDDLDTGDVFNRCLDSFEIGGEERMKLINSYNEIIKDLQEDDCNAE